MYLEKYTKKAQEKMQHAAMALWVWPADDIDNVYNIECHWWAFWMTSLSSVWCTMAQINTLLLELDQSIFIRHKHRIDSLYSFFFLPLHRKTHFIKPLIQTWVIVLNNQQ